MSALYRWYATPLHNPDHLLAGPFETRAEADKACLQLVSETEKWRAANDAVETGRLNVTNYYTVRMVKVVVETLIVKPVEIEAPIDPQAQVLAKLTAKLHSLSTGDLIKVCGALGITVTFKPRKDLLIQLIKAKVK